MDKSIKIFVVANLILAIPSWGSLIDSQIYPKLHYAYLLIWHLPILFILNKQFYSKKLVLLFAYLAMISVLLLFILLISILGIWEALLNLSVYLTFVMVYLKFNYMLMLVNYIRSGAADELYLKNE